MISTNNRNIFLNTSHQKQVGWQLQIVHDYPGCIKNEKKQNKKNSGLCIVLVYQVSQSLTLQKTEWERGRKCY